MIDHAWMAADRELEWSLYKPASAGFFIACEKVPRQMLVRTGQRRSDKQTMAYWLPSTPTLPSTLAMNACKVIFWPLKSTTSLA